MPRDTPGLTMDLAWRFKLGQVRGAEDRELAARVEVMERIADREGFEEVMGASDESREG